MELKIEQIDKKKIKIPDWQPRKDDEPSDDLVHSIKNKGLINAITVRKDNGKYNLTAGVRRFKALNKLDNESIPCNVTDETDFESKQTSWDENNVRQNLDELKNEKFVYDWWIEGKELGKWKTINDMANKIGITQATLFAIIHGHEERKVIDVYNSDELTYDDFYRSRSLENYPETRKKVLEKRANREIESQGELYKISKRLVEFEEPEQQEEELERILERKKTYREMEEGDYVKDVEISQGIREPEHIIEIESDSDKRLINSYYEIESKVHEIYSDHIKHFKDEKHKQEAIHIIQDIIIYLNKQLVDLDVISEVNA